MLLRSSNLNKNLALKAEVLRSFSTWKKISSPIFSDEKDKELVTVFGYFDLTDQKEFGEYLALQDSSKFPQFSKYLNFDTNPKIQPILKHIRDFHFSKSGIDHFGIAIYDFLVLSNENEYETLKKIGKGIICALDELDLSNLVTAFYAFQGLRNLKLIDILTPHLNWSELEFLFPQLPCPSSNLLTELSFSEKKEYNEFLIKFGNSNSFNLSFNV